MAKSRRYKYDVFISHAVEDKLAIANELSEAMEKAGLKVWYSGRELSVGDRLIDTIHTGLDECRFGVVILSPTYLGKIWALNEFFTLIHREKEGQKVVLPVLYDITPEELGARYPAMADIFAVRASKGIDHVTSILYNEIRKIQTKEPHAIVDKISKPFNKKIVLWIGLFLLLVTSLYGLSKIVGESPPSKTIHAAIDQRIEALQKEADQQGQLLSTTHNTATAEEIKTIYREFVTTKSYFRNEFTLNTGKQVIHAKRNVGMALAIDMETLSPFNQYSFSAPLIYRSTTSSSGYRKEHYTFVNTQPLTYKIENTDEIDHQFQVVVKYEQFIRVIETTLDFPTSAKDTKRHHQSITAIRPEETYIFQKEGEQWIVKSIE